MRGMQLLGEPFVFGSDSLEAFMRSNGFACLAVAPSNLYLSDKTDPVYSIYSFCLASAAIAPALERKSASRGPCRRRTFRRRSGPSPRIPSSADRRATPWLPI